jgi:hypothetical protein
MRISRKTETETMFKALPTYRSSSVSSHAEVPPARLCGFPANDHGPGLFLDRLIAYGDPGDLISLLHRQAAWRGLLSHGDPTSHG